MLGRFLVALVSLAALLGVGCNGPPIEVVRRTMGSLEAIAAEHQEREVALRPHGGATAVRGSETSRSADEPREAPPLTAMVVSSEAGRFASAGSSSLCPPHPEAWAAPAPTHAELMVFLN